jgi:peptidoglycan/LPS O-acetylase OafA/YrhL
MPELDGLRFVAFLMVFIHHIPFPREWIVSSAILHRVHAFGWVGVDIFLVLSAYLLTKLGLREFEKTGEFDIRKFYYRRALRIWPLYFLGLAIGFFIYPLVLSAVGQTTTPFWGGIRDHLVPYLFFAGNFSYAVFRDTLGLYKSLWTICLEEQFYLLFPVLLTVFMAKRRTLEITMAAVIVIAVASMFRSYMQIVSVPYPWIWVSPVTRLDPFAIGIALAFVERNGTFRTSAPLLLSIAGALFILISNFPQLGQSNHAIWQLLASAVASGALLIAVRQHPVAVWFSWFPIVLLGKISFGLYVYHRFAIDIFVRVTRALEIDGNTPIQWCIAAMLCMLATILVSIASYVLFERRFQMWKSHYEIIPSRPVSLLSDDLTKSRSVSD